MTRQEIVDGYGVSEETQKAIAAEHHKLACHMGFGAHGTYTALEEKYHIDIDKLMSIVILQGEKRRIEP